MLANKLCTGVVGVASGVVSWWLQRLGRLDVEFHNGRLFVGWYPDIALTELSDKRIDTVITPILPIYYDFFTEPLLSMQATMIEVKPTGDARGNGAFALCTIPAGKISTKPAQSWEND